MISSPHNLEPYGDLHVFEACLGGEEIQFVSKRGFPGWDRISPAIALLVQVIELQPGWQVLVLGSGCSALGVFLGRRVDPGKVWLSETNFLDRSSTALTFEANGIANAHLVEDFTLPAEQEGSFDCAIQILPKGRKFAQGRLVEAWSGLRVGGVFYLAGANDEGIRSVIQDAEELFGPAMILGYKKGNRVAKFVRFPDRRPLPAWSLEPGIARHSWFEFEAGIAGKCFIVASLPGIFSYDRIDPGSQLLLNVMEVGSNDRILDLGCGWGILGLSAARLGAKQVDLVDVDLLAIAASGENINRLALSTARAIASDITFAVRDQTYTQVVTNPPFHSGKEVDYVVAYAFITQANQVLLPGGRLLLVANKFIRYEKLMREVYRQVTLLADDNHYQVWSAIK